MLLFFRNPFSFNLRKNLFNGPSFLDSPSNQLRGSIEFPCPSRNRKSLITKSKPSYISLAYSLIGRRGQRSFYTPTIAINSRLYYILVNSGFSSPLSQMKRFAIKFNCFICSCILRLLHFCRPITIRRLIISVIISAINGVCRTRSCPHIFGKILKRIKPSITYLYATTPVIMVCSIITVIASLLHLCPKLVVRMFCVHKLNIPCFLVGGKFK